MQVEMPMGVDVIERQPGGAEGFELRLDLGGKLAPCRRPREYVEAESWQIVRPLTSTRCGMFSGGSVGRPSTSTTCRPTRSFGRRRSARPHRRRLRQTPSGLRPTGCHRGGRSRPQR
jgi:hypothetical protein